MAMIEVVVVVVVVVVLTASRCRCSIWHDVESGFMYNRPEGNNGHETMCDDR